MTIGRLLWYPFAAVIAVPLFLFLVVFYATVRPHTLIDPFRRARR